MQPYHYWLIAAIILVLVEVFTSGFGVVCFAIGAALGALLAYLEVSLAWQLTGFVVLSLLAFIFLRPLVLRYLTRKTHETPMNADALIGKRGQVVEEVNPQKHTGSIKIDGDVWSARSAHGQILPAGSEVQVFERESIVLLVALPETEENQQ